MEFFSPLNQEILSHYLVLLRPGSCFLFWPSLFDLLQNMRASLCLKYSRQSADWGWSPSSLFSRDRLCSQTIRAVLLIVDDDQGTIEVDRSQLRKFENFLGLFSANMMLPISREWFATDLFPLKRSKAPSSRAQDLQAMVGLMSAWTRNGRLFFPRNPHGLR